MKRLLSLALGAGLLWLWLPDLQAMVGAAIMPKAPAKALVAAPPLQTPVSQASFTHNKFTITPLAQYDITARVLGSRTYWFDHESALAPIDLAVGWQQMSDNTLLDRLTISQSMRFYWWRYEQAVDEAVVIGHSANMHLIPASYGIGRALRALPKGAVVRLRGWLVEATEADGWHWKSSLTRSDTGAGACELMWVTSVERLL